ncbi:class I SAM-dependent methyltransferase [Sphingomonas endolithica]|uniref:class I SAM-dependent methyltransferase n=1 Tax=Sphingomonas endolithica TaxID=2972485 RepID=UPI0021B01EF3|nr:class I SAM-dependent methyltransferase [Sphingomonas sp. ZFBP2030]
MDTLQPFTDRVAIARYAEDTPRKVPGYADLHRMAMLLLAETAPEAANILVYGAGGGLELKAFAEAQPSWSLTGVDPSAEMLDLAREVLGPIIDSVILQQGFIDDAPGGPFDGATCLLTMHFLDRAARLYALRQLRLRLKPGARLVIAHHSCPAGVNAQPWIARSIAFSDTGRNDLQAACVSAEAMVSVLPILFSDEEEALLREAGYSDVSLFYAAFSFRGWVATAGSLAPGAFSA